MEEDRNCCGGTNQSIVIRHFSASRASSDLSGRACAYAPMQMSFPHGNIPSQHKSLYSSNACKERDSPANPVYFMNTNDNTNPFKSLICDLREVAGMRLVAWNASRIRGFHQLKFSHLGKREVVGFQYNIVVLGSEIAKSEGHCSFSTGGVLADPWGILALSAWQFELAYVCFILFNIRIRMYWENVSTWNCTWASMILNYRVRSISILPFIAQSTIKWPSRLPISHPYSGSGRQIRDTLL